jgi:hypothetical protein
METRDMVEWTDSALSDLGALGNEVMSRFTMPGMLDDHAPTIPDDLRSVRHPDPLPSRRDLPLDLSMDLPRTGGWAGAPRHGPRHR